MTDGPRRKLSRGKKLGFALGLLALGLVLGEVVARVAVPPARPIYLEHPYLGRVRAPSSSQEFSASPCWSGSYTLHIDEHGFRATSLEPPGAPKTPGTYRVFFVGASAVENLAVPDAETFEARVEAELNRRLGGSPRVVAINAGRSGATIADSFAHLAHRVLALEPDLVVVMDGLNDMLAATSSRFDPTHWRARIEPEPPSPGDVLRQWSRLAAVLDGIGDRAGTGARQEKWKRRRREQPFTPGVDATRGVPYIQRYLALISAACAEAGVPLAFMTHPSIWKPAPSPEEEAALWMGWVAHGEVNLDTPTLLRGIRAVNEAVRRHADARGNLLIDLDAAVPKDLAHFYDDCHFTPRGNEVAARAIVDALLQGGRLP